MTAGAHDHDEIRAELANLRVELAAVQARAQAQETAAASTAAVAAETAATTVAATAYDAQADIARIGDQMAALEERLATPPEPKPVIVPEPVSLPPLPEEGEGDVPPPPETENKPPAKKKKSRMDWFP